MASGSRLLLRRHLLRCMLPRFARRRWTNLLDENVVNATFLPAEGHLTVRELALEASSLVQPTSVPLLTANQARGTTSSPVVRKIEDGVVSGTGQDSNLEAMVNISSRTPILAYYPENRAASASGSKQGDVKQSIAFNLADAEVEREA
eukprot:GSA120T00012693001.1